MYDEHTCWTCFRFHKDQMPRLLRALKLDKGSPGRLDGNFSTASKYKFQPMEALVAFLGRMSYPNTWEQRITLLGGRDPRHYSQIFSLVLEHIYTEFGPAVSDITRWADYAEDFAHAIRSKSPAQSCVGFIDGTMRKICRPTLNQRDFYNGYKKFHSIKFQSVQGPNGLYLDIFGPIIGRRSDPYVFRQSQLTTRMAALCRVTRRHYYVYGDPAYPMGRYVLRGFKGAASPAQLAFSTEMSSVRESVEWGFSLIIRDWAFLDFHKNQKVWKQPVAKMYVCGAVLTNIKTCMQAEQDGYGNEIAKFFGVHPPTLEEYVRL